jgi:small subunit ribosomal protein S20
MANHKSAAKKARRDETLRLRNRFWRTRMRSQVRKFRTLVDKGDRTSAEALLTETLGLVDRTARAGVIHERTASRYKSRLQLAFNKTGAQA